MTKDEIHATIMAEIQQARDAITKAGTPLNDLIDGLTFLKEQSGGRFDFWVSHSEFAPVGTTEITTSVREDGQLPLCVWVYPHGQMLLGHGPRKTGYDWNGDSGNDKTSGIAAFLKEIVKQAIECGQIPAKPASPVLSHRPN